MRRNQLLAIIVSSSVLTLSQLWAESLPKSLGDWTLTERRAYPAQALYDYINGGAEVYYEYGFSTVDVGYYSQGEREILVEVYTMSGPQAAMGIYSFFRNHTAPSLPEPYTGKLYDFHLECLNGREFIKLIHYDSVGVDERFFLLHELIPKPKQLTNPIHFDILPAKRLPGSEIYFNGPISLRNFASLGRKNHFGVGDRARAYGCLTELHGKQYKWVTVVGDSLRLREDSQRFLAFQRRNDYDIKDESGCTILEDQLTDNNIGMIHRGNRLHFVFGFGEGERKKILDFITSQE